MEEKETGRTEAFSDGVFAVAITLLVLNIKIPGLDLSPSNLPNDAQLSILLRNEWPVLAAYATSFATIGVMWLNHHRLYTHIKRIDTGLLLLNLLLLLVIVFIPVPTALVAEYLVHLDQHAAALLYSGTMVILAVCYNLLWRYASYHNRLLGKNADVRLVKAISRQYWGGPLAYLIAFVLALFNTPASLILNFLLALFFAIPPRLPRSLPEQSYNQSESD
ncbi:MAG TPA: TMEM175 family protein [Ktedonobacteraceae bacterium]|nr:TMEM175 family protein [Ktedonobacteraceae bacterium]